MKLVFFCNNKANLPILSSDDSIISSLNEFQDFWKSPQKKLVKGIIIWAELNWEGFQLTDFLGFKLIRTIRLEQKCWLSIIITGYAPEEYFSKTSESSTYFIAAARLDSSIRYYSIQELDKNKSNLSLLFDLPIADKNLQLDITRMAYNSLGFVYESHHKITADLRKLASTPDWKAANFARMINKLFRDFKQLYPKESLFLDNSEQLLLQKLKQLEFPSLPSNVYNTCIEAFNKIEFTLDKNYAKKPTKSPSIVKVMYIDDEESDRKLLKSYLKKYGIECFTTANSTDAITVLKKHTDVNVVICDYRFYDKLGRIAREQGYHIIGKIRGTLKRRIAFIALTSYNEFHRELLLDKHRDAVYEKKRILDSLQGFGTFLTMIIERHKEVKIENDCSTLAFRRVEYWDYYQHIRAMHDNLTQFEKDISDYALAFVKEVKNNGDFKHIQALKGLTTNIKLPVNKKDLVAFKEILKARRTILGLCQLPEEDLGYYKSTSRKWIVVHSLIKYLDLNHDKDDSFTKFWSVNIQLKRGTTDYSNKDRSKLPITKEEREWLQQHFK